MFTSALVAGLRSGDADRDQDGQVSLDELYEYVFDHVQTSTTSQHPEKWVYGSRGALYVARNAQGVPALPLPEQIRQNLRHESRFIREAGIRELVELANTTDDRRLMVSVRHALEQLAEDDSKSVASRATAALADIPDIDSVMAARPPQPASQPRGLDQVSAGRPPPGSGRKASARSATAMRRPASSVTRTSITIWVRPDLTTRASAVRVLPACAAER